MRRASLVSKARRIMWLMEDSLPSDQPRVSLFLASREELCRCMGCGFFLERVAPGKPRISSFTEYEGSYPGRIVASLGQETRLPIILG